ncbi:Ribosomal protein S18 protein [Raphanus sativus]|nr:Ribosomal protein S18 protein [Raphanus sativus]
MQKPRQNNKAEITTEEVLKKADFRNVRFLAQFITEAGILVKRKQTGISAKAQRKIAREIKTARAFGLMPFTTMGTKAFTFGKPWRTETKISSMKWLTMMMSMTMQLSEICSTLFCFLNLWPN